MRGLPSLIRTERFMPVWKAAEKFERDGTQRATHCSAGNCSGFIRKRGPGLECEVMPTRTLRSVLAALLALTLLLPACSDNRSANTVAAAAPGAVAPAVPAKSEAVAEKGFTVSGPLIVEHQLDVLSQRDGVVARLFADEGTRVKEGEILAQLVDRQIVGALEERR